MSDARDWMSRRSLRTNFSFFDGHVQRMFVCLKHVEDDPGEERSGTRPWDSEVARGSRRHEPFRFPQEGISACGGAAHDAGVVGARATSPAHPGQTEPRPGNTRAAGFAMIVLDASVV